MSFQEYEDLIGELEGQNDDLRYRLSFSASEQENLSSGLRELMLENEQLLHRVMNLEQALKAERENAISREHSLRRALKEKNVIIDELETSPVGGSGSRMSLNSSTSELEEDGEGSKRKLYAAEQDIEARDMLIEELEMTVEDLHKQYHNSRVDSDITLYEMTQTMKLLEEKLADAELLLNDENIKYLELLDKHHSFEELYEGLFEKFNHELSLTEQLSEKLTATEFDLFATAERLDEIHQERISHTSVSVGTCTDAVSVDIEKLKLTGELDKLMEKYENSLYRVSELSVDNATLETKLIDVETELDNYHKLLNQSNSRPTEHRKGSVHSTSSLNYLLSKKEETIHNLTLKLEEFQSEKLRRENELLEKVNDLTANKHQLCQRLESYEDEIFELSEQIAMIETEKEESCGRDEKLKAISRRLSTLNLLSVRETPLLSPVERGKCSEGGSRRGSTSTASGKRV